MPEIQTYPDGVPAAGDKIPYVADPSGAPTFKLADLSDVGAGGGGGGTSNPWGLMADTAATVVDEFDGVSPLTWTPVVPAVNGGHVTWTVGNDVMSAKFGAQTDAVSTFNTVPHALAVGESVEIAASMVSARILGLVGLVILDGTADASNLMIAGVYNDGSGFNNVIWRDGTVAWATAGINTYFGLTYYGRSLRHRLLRVTSNTWRYEISIDGVSWTNLGITDQTWPHTPSHVGFAVSAWGANTATYGDHIAAFDYLRVY